MRKLRLLLVLCAMTFATFCAAATPAWADTMSSVGYLDKGGSATSCSSATVVEDGVSSLGESGRETWYVVSKNVETNSRIEIKGTVNLILVNGFKLTVNNGVHVLQDYALVVFGQQGHAGKLVTKGGGGNAAIGGNYACTAGKIVINGGTIEAMVQDSDYAAIGGGRPNTQVDYEFGGNFQGIEINGGNVTATGGYVGIGAGALNSNRNGEFKITGGVVTASGIGVGGRFGADLRLTGGEARLIDGSGFVGVNENDQSWSGLVYKGYSEGSDGKDAYKTLDVYGEQTLSEQPPSDAKIQVMSGAKLNLNCVVNESQISCADGGSVEFVHQITSEEKPKAPQRAADGVGATYVNFDVPSDKYINVTEIGYVEGADAEAKDVPVDQWQKIYSEDNGSLRDGGTLIKNLKPKTAYTFFTRYNAYELLETSAGATIKLTKEPPTYRITTAGTSESEEGSLLGLNSWLKQQMDVNPDEQPYVYLDADVELEKFSPVDGFVGIFDGQGNTIRIGSIAYSRNGGLFTDVSGTIRRLCVKVNKVDNPGQDNKRAGAICGHLKASGRIEECSAIVTEGIFAKGWNVGYAGGIAGDCEGLIENCVTRVNYLGADARQTDKYAYGGIAGRVSDTGIIKNCYTNQSGLSSSVSGTAEGQAQVADFRSGEFVLALNGDRGVDGPWRQNLWGDNADAMPVPNTGHRMVYACDCGGVRFTNKPGVLQDHRDEHTPEGESNARYCGNCGYPYKKLDFSGLEASAITYGDNLSDSKISGFDEGWGEFVWDNPDTILRVGMNACKIIFKPSDSTEKGYYSYETECEVTVTVKPSPNTPNMPDDAMDAPYSAATVGDLKLKGDWEWEDPGIDLTKVNPGETVKATARYVGADAGNYETVEVEITITRAAPDVPPAPGPDPEPKPEPEVPAWKSCPRDETCPLAAFPDADPAAWYHEPMHWAVVEGVLAGYTGSGLMAPNDVMTRAMAATVLFRMSGDAAPAGESGFADVSPNAWYAGTVAWAAQNGVFNGYGTTGRFGPSDAITREQMACVLMRRAEAAGLDTSARADLSRFSDADALTFGAEPMSWAVAAGLFSGYEGTSELGPTDGLTRAQCAAVLQRYSQLAANGEPAA